MAKADFIFEGKSFTIQCDKNEKLKDICSKLSAKINEDINTLTFIYERKQINLDKTFNELTKENKINFLVFKTENETYPNYGKMLDNKTVEDIISLNNDAYYALAGLLIQMENILKNNMKLNDINYLDSQLRSIKATIYNINEDIKNIKIHLNKIKNNSNEKLKQNKSSDKNVEKESKNQIIAIYRKETDEINLLHDYSYDINTFGEKQKIWYMEGKDNINENNIDIYINDNKIKFDYKYKSNERGDIKVKFIFRNLLTITYQMFRDCKSLISIDLSSFDTTNVSNIGFMFMECSFLESIDLSLHNTTNIKDISSMFWRCSSLRSIDLSSFNPANINSMVCLFYKCSSLKKENVKFKNSDKKLISEINQLSN